MVVTRGKKATTKTPYRLLPKRKFRAFYEDWSPVQLGKKTDSVFTAPYPSAAARKIARRVNLQGKHFYIRRLAPKGLRTPAKSKTIPFERSTSKWEAEATAPRKIKLMGKLFNQEVQGPDGQWVTKYKWGNTTNSEDKTVTLKHQFNKNGNPLKIPLAVTLFGARPKTIKVTRLSYQKSKKGKKPLAIYYNQSAMDSQEKQGRYIGKYYKKKLYEGYLRGKNVPKGFEGWTASRWQRPSSEPKAKKETQAQKENKKKVKAHVKEAEAHGRKATAFANKAVSVLNKNIPGTLFGSPAGVRRSARLRST